MTPPVGASRVIGFAGLVAGALDLTAAIVVSWLRAGVSPVRVMQSISSGLLGAASFEGGAQTAALGVMLHFLIATIWAAVFSVASRRLRVLVQRPVTTGLLYGVVVYAFMNFVVLPLSAVSLRPVTLTGRLVGMLIIMFCIGLPIALIVSRSSRALPRSAPGR